MEDIRSFATRPEIRALDVSAFGRQDLLNLVLQRSEILWDVPRAGQVTRAWSMGDTSRVEAEVDRLGPEIVYRAAGVIFGEYHELEPELGALAPKRVADIGCGYAIFDLFLAQRLDVDLLLIDLEANEHRHFGFQTEGAAYSSLSVARSFLEANSIAPDRIRTVNPRTHDLTGVGPVDLAVSFLSCGYHYPVDMYLEFFRSEVEDNGTVILDLRDNTAQAQIDQLSRIGRVTAKPVRNKARRVTVRKRAA